MLRKLDKETSPLLPHPTRRKLWCCTRDETNRKCNKTVQFETNSPCPSARCYQQAWEARGRRGATGKREGGGSRIEEKRVCFSALRGDEACNLHMLLMHCKSCLRYAPIIFYANCLSAAIVSYTYSCCRRNMAPVCRPAGYVKSLR